MKTALVFVGWLLAFAAVGGVAVAIATVSMRIGKWLEKKGMRFATAHTLPFAAIVCVLYAAVFTWVIPRIATK